MPQCEKCQDIGWVCENDGRPWAKDVPNGCECGAGMPCPACNVPAEGELPRVTGVITSIFATRDKVQVH